MKSAGVVFLLDCDNTLLDNDRVQDDLREHLVRELGPGECEGYWAAFEALRTKLGYADYLGALQVLRLAGKDDQRAMRMAAFLLDYPFARRLYRRALDVIGHLGRWGPTVILSDGDAVFQPHKIERSGLSRAVEGRVLIYIHKEKMLDEVKRLHPARHYVMVDDKLKVLAAMKKTWRERLTTVFPRQGHYAKDRKILASAPPADLAIDRIAELLHCRYPESFTPRDPRGGKKEAK